MSRLQVRGTVHKTDTSPVCLYNSTYMSYILYPTSNPKRYHYSYRITSPYYVSTRVGSLQSGENRMSHNLKLTTVEQNIIFFTISILC